MLQKLYTSSLIYSNEIKKFKDSDTKIDAPQVSDSYQFHEPDSVSSEEKDSEISLDSMERRNRKLQLIYIIKNLQELHMNNYQYLTHLLNAQNDLVNDRVAEAANHLQNILYDESLDEPLQKVHSYIVHEAKKIVYNDIM